MHHPKNPVLVFHGWDETVPRGQFTWSVIYFFFWSFFSGQFLFPSSVFFFLGTVFIPLSFWPILESKFFLGSSYLHPTYLPALLPANPATSLILLTPPHPAICAHFQDPRVLFLPAITRQVSSAIAKKLRSLGAMQEELRNFNVVAGAKER